jgi:hypothetical protein
MEKLLDLVEEVKEKIDSNSYNEIMKELGKIQEESYSKVSYIRCGIKNETLPTDENLLMLKVDTEKETRLVKNNNLDAFLSEGDLIDFMGGVKVCNEIAGNLDHNLYKFQCTQCGEEVKVVIRNPRNLFISKKEYK